MTREEEAIMNLSYILVGFPETSARGKAVLTAIEALKKQIPQKPVKEKNEYIYRCRKCDSDVVGSGYYCWKCGQKIDWA